MTESRDDFRLQRIVSGGQTGVDRAALDAAIAIGIPHGGWCPRGRLAEDGAIPERYALRETASDEYPVRTRQNVLDSDGTLIIYRVIMMGGTRLTANLAREHRKPFLSLDLTEDIDLAAIQQWLVRHQIKVLNVAGPRESTSPGMTAEAFRLIKQLLSLTNNPATDA
jgi:hypothetical protein